MNINHSCTWVKAISTKRSIFNFDAKNYLRLQLRHPQRRRSCSFHVTCLGANQPHQNVWKCVQLCSRHSNQISRILSYLDWIGELRVIDHMYTCTCAWGAAPHSTYKCPVHWKYPFLIKFIGVAMVNNIFRCTL